VVRDTTSSTPVNAKWLRCKPGGYGAAALSMPWAWLASTLRPRHIKELNPFRGTDSDFSLDVQWFLGADSCLW
ncbi:hypothetical protein, partial [Paracoccus lichenicola]|uniref:hypothetical protein n=1 Tax=Paracoccus lichenicola TaxID=2665644 RepID=UPI001E32A740